MKKDKFEKYHVSQVGVLIRNNKCLLLKYANGYWGLPGGRVEVEEKRDAAFRREIWEEIGIKDIKILDFIGYNLWYTKKHHHAMCGTFMLIENGHGMVKLSPEHLQYKWVSENEGGNMRFFWPDVKPMIKKGFKRYRELKKINVA